MSILHELLYASPTLLGVSQLLACAVASTSILYFCRPSRGPGYWATCCWLLAISYVLFAIDHVNDSLQIFWLTDLLLIGAQAFMMLGIYRFLGQPLPLWIIPASTVPMLLVDVLRGHDHLPQALADAAYCLLVIGLALSTIKGLRGQEHARAVRIFIICSLAAYALSHLIRLLLGLGHAWSGSLPVFQEADSIPLLSFYSGLPFLVIALVALTAMSLHRTLAESRKHATQARANLMRFEQLMRISSAATLLVHNGRIADSNPKLDELFGCRSNALHGRLFSELFHQDTDPQLLRQLGEEAPLNLIAIRVDQGSFQSEVTLRALDEDHDLVEIRDVSRQKAMEAQLARLASTDPLTGALNRRAFDERYRQEQQRASRQPVDLCLAALDLDHFKQINDQYGHAVGDDVLVTFTRICRQHARATDIFARFGGEEFVFLLPDCRPDDALQLLTRIRLTLLETPIDGIQADRRISFSAGLTICIAGASLDDTLRNADAALYHAKQNGRDRIEVAS
ncbi:sensor domain-containing diguanylate cyclase [Pseudomonas sp. LRF_L74]|uniref:sensor domain-containing diguanylate cyclase n=1 Tax=Pseudomonas sp. LRF_L74 TaxID=3369422 RepID=UPI003F5EC958